MIEELLKNGSKNILQDLTFYVVGISDGAIVKAKCSKIVINKSLPYINLYLRNAEANYEYLKFELEDLNTSTYSNISYFAFLSEVEAIKKSKILKMCNLEKEYDLVHRQIELYSEKKKSLEEQMENLEKEINNEEEANA